MLISQRHAASALLVNTLDTLRAPKSNIRTFPESVWCGARRLRLSNKRIQETLVDVSGGIEFLQAAGFQLAFEEDAQTQATEGCANLGTP